ncbi:uncharacterized protein NMK_2203 [Novimethylophilus kurashikiensis]|uniref:Uncharacterized protein n=1 Tax=Novimethylophilus kurashikiensis TaxID=1825523 RepID=A0A2R5FDF1_9PROT|nr:hypothetical protein [Novimethylophilus kurashikiensis]GBG14604.1 uncharacterized protein NMK_2203 [Novimethylophilus kurashikiensis]
MAKRIFERVMQKALRQTEFDRECGFIKDVKPEGSYWRDAYCADGVIASGNRIIKAGGVIHFGGTRWQDDALVPLVGKLVGVCMGDVYCTDIEVYWGGYPCGAQLMTIDTHLPTKPKQ